jgi:four helix bundle protein
MVQPSGGYRTLIAWQKAQALAVAVVKLVKASVRDMAADAIRFQLVRSAGSIAANIAEGYGRFSLGAYRNHLSIARGSLSETETWVDLLYQSDYITSIQNDELMKQCSDVGKLLTALMRTLPQDRTRRTQD